MSLYYDFTCVVHLKRLKSYLSEQLCKLKQLIAL